jgi:hypothetical protein
MARKSNLLVTTAKIKNKVFYFIDGVGPNGPHVEAKGDNVCFINPDENYKRDMSYVGSAISLMVEAYSEK